MSLGAEPSTYTLTGRDAGSKVGNIDGSQATIKVGRLKCQVAWGSLGIMYGHGTMAVSPQAGIGT